MLGAFGFFRTRFLCSPALFFGFALESAKKARVPTQLWL
jgi:hypothetical protein